MLVYRTITLAYILQKITPHLSFQRLMRMAKVEAVPFYRFQLPLSQKFLTLPPLPHACCLPAQLAIYALIKL